MAVKESLRLRATRVIPGPISPTQTARPVITAMLSLYTNASAGRLWLIAMDGVWSTEDFGVNWTFTNRGLRSDW